MLSNREIAISVCLCMLFLFGVTKRPVRESLLRVAKAFFQRRLLPIVILIISYFTSIVWVLYRVGFWTPVLLKDTIVWFCLSGMVHTFSALAAQPCENIIFGIVTDSLKAVVLLEFFISQHTFSLVCELLLVPFATLIMMIDVVASSESRYSEVSKLMKGLQTAVGFVVLSRAITGAVSSLDSLFTIESIRELLLAPILSVFMVPLIYFLVIFIRYEDLFVLLDSWPGMDRSTKAYAKRRFIEQLGINIHRIDTFISVHKWNVRRIKSKEDVDALLRKMGSNS